MTTTLVSFLGRVPRDKDSGRYKTACYRFSDGYKIETPFFGLALLERLDPDRLVLLGTRGSMWDVLIEHLVSGPAHEDLRLALLEAAEASQVSTEMVERIQPVLEHAIGKPCTVQLIDYGRDAGEQMAILEAIAAAVPRGAVTLDLTHGFRHLAALGLLSGFFLERVERLRIEGLYYGALDMTDPDTGITPVVRLDGLLAVQRWIDALERFDHSGDYAVFTPLLVADGMPADKARCLEEAAFHERTFNLADAVRKIRTFLPTLDAGLVGTSTYFQDRLGRRLEWARAGSLAEHQRRLAYIYLKRRDFVRAAVFAWESLITRECETHGLDRNDFSKDGGRDQAEQALREGLGADGQRWRDSAPNRLKAVRNALAHGNPPAWDDVRKALSDPERLYRMLEADFKRVLG